MYEMAVKNQNSQYLSIMLKIKKKVILLKKYFIKFLEKEMATHSSILAWRIPGTEEPNGLLSMGLHRVRHDWSDVAAVIKFIFFPFQLREIQHPADLLSLQ